MAANPSSDKRSGSTGSIDAEDKDRLIARLTDRIAPLEKELRLKQEDASSVEAIEVKRDEDALRESRELYRTLFDNTNDGFVLVEPIFDETGNSDDYHMLEVNSAWERQTGLIAADLVGKRIREALPNVEHVWPATFAEVAMKGDARHFESYNANSRRWYDIHAFPYRDGQVGVLFRDITERKRAEDALRVSADNQARAEKLADLGYWDWDLTTNRVKWSDGHFRIFGYPVAPGTETYESFRGRVHPEDVDVLENVLREGMEKDTGYNWNYRLLLPDGSIRYVHAEADRPVKDATGKPVRWFGIVQDVTGRKLAEEALRKSERDLSFELDAARELQQVSSQLIQAGDAEALYSLILETIVNVMHADFASLQLFDPGRGELRLLGHRGFDESAARFWEYVRPDSQSTCGVALCTGRRVVVPDVERCKFMRGSEDQATYLETGIHAVQTTPLVSRSGALVGMFSSHWREVHEPTASELRSLDILARQASDLIESKLAEEALHKAMDESESQVQERTADLQKANDVLMAEIAERKRTEIALRESEERFRKVFENTCVGALIADANRNCLACNERLSEILGYSQEYLLTSGCGHLMHPDDQARDIAHVQRLLRGEASSFMDEFRFIHANGSTVWIRINASVLRGSGEDTQLISIFEDITERKQAESELEKHHKRLEDLVQERTRNLEDARAQAELYLDLMGHDLNNMHQIALGCLELARDNQQDAGQTGLLDKSIEVLNRSARLIKNVNKLQKLNEGVLQTNEVNLYQVLQDVGWEFGEVSNKTIILNYNGCEKCLVKANELLYDVFANLVGNAIKHTGDHTVINISLDIITEEKCKYYWVGVEDNGPGIPDEYKDKIFDRMLRGTTNAKGMGLGLYLVKSLVNSYNGYVWVEDRIPGDHTKGARFVVMLPASEISPN